MKLIAVGDNVTDCYLEMCIRDRFNGGIIPLFMVVSKLHLNNTIWSLVLPGAVPVFNVILLINFFKGVPESLDEAARIDGAGPLTVLLKVYLPISLPALATVGLFAIVNHWNDYFSGLIYMSKASMYPLQTYIQQLTVDLTQITDADQLKQLAALNNRSFNAVSYTHLMLWSVQLSASLQNSFSL